MASVQSHAFVQYTEAIHSSVLTACSLHRPNTLQRARRCIESKKTPCVPKSGAMTLIRAFTFTFFMEKQNFCDGSALFIGRIDVFFSHGGHKKLQRRKRQCMGRQNWREPEGGNDTIVLLCTLVTQRVLMLHWLRLKKTPVNKYTLQQCSYNDFVTM